MGDEIVKVSPNGQIVIPKEMREKMHIESGSRFIAHPVDGDILLKRLEMPSFDEWHKRMKPYRHNTKGKSEEEIVRIADKGRKK